jgi:hypothetical protein
MEPKPERTGMAPRMVQYRITAYNLQISKKHSGPGKKIKSILHVITKGSIKSAIATMRNPVHRDGKCFAI